MKIINFDNVTGENIKYHNQNWLQNLDHPYRILTIGGSGSGKPNVLLHSESHQRNIYKLYLYAKDKFEAKYQFIISKRENVGLNHCNDCKSFIEYLNDMNDNYGNIYEHNPNKKLTCDMI